MTSELKKRIVTSIVLLVIALLCITINKEFFYISSITIGIICFIEWCKINLKSLTKRRSIVYFLVIISGFIYLFVILQFSMFFMRGDSSEDIIFFIFVLFICIFSDVGGYVIGKTIGGKKLTSISPNKTISGSFGSFIFSVLPLFLFSYQNFIFLNFDLSLKNIFFCLIISLSCQVGDLIISYFKRLSSVKDSGIILPGHGGLLDRIDGIIFAIPVACILKLSQIF